MKEFKILMKFYQMINVKFDHNLVNTYVLHTLLQLKHLCIHKYHYIGDQKIASFARVHY